MTKEFILKGIEITLIKEHAKQLGLKDNKNVMMIPLEQIDLLRQKLLPLVEEAVKDELDWEDVGKRINKLFGVKE